MNYKLSFLFMSLLFFMSINLMAQNPKQYNIQKLNTKAKIDGQLSDGVWKNLPTATGFVQFEPGFNIPATEDRKTEVKLFYNDKGLYLSAILYDDPELIMKQITQRDDFGQTDFFRVVINPNNDAQNDTEFIVFSSGTQADALSSPSLGRDFGWDAVWKSAVKHTDKGWQLEMMIPYRSLRFPKNKIQTWGIQFRRFFRRERSEYAWNPINPTKGYSGIYHGELHGIKDLEPPLRLNLFPFTTAIGNLVDNDSETDFKLGMDVKYGITDNITLDATLIPDFSQARFDNVVLNLGPFEQTFAEQRQFFKEGVELFTKGDLFFSRRVGNAPIGQVDLQENEIEIDRPDKVDLINAAKVSGRLKNGLGIGVFNAITEKTKTTILDTITDTTRQETVEPLTNYNIVVVDKQFNRNSSVTFINTNTTRQGDFRDANVTGALFDLRTKANTYRLSGEAKMSYLNLDNDSQTGFRTNLRIGKIFGNYRYSLEHDYADDQYDINDLGLIFRNNFNNLTGRFSYEIFEPTEKFQSYRLSFRAEYRRLAQPSTYTGLRLNADLFATDLNLDTFGLNLDFNPGKQFDFFEPRVDEQFFITENFVNFGGFISSNYNRTFALDLRMNANTFIESGRDSFSYRINISPRVRFNDYFFMVYDFNFDKRLNDRGFASFLDDEPIFGERDREIIVNSIRANYNFNSYNGLSLQFRHYWDTVLYDELMYNLNNNNGRISINENLPKTALNSSPDVNFSTWNVDLNYVWQFAPGSFLTVLYRQQLFQNNDRATQSYTNTLSDLFNQDFQHTLSVRLQYFIDVNDVKDAVFKGS
ncbi:protein with DOMON-like ligand-binding domain protein [Flavobacteriaceae bacterium 14752]|nr:protein with DOMON-like ligand-binding domain protein [Flavobacteriaceae bacterium 14752]